MDRKCICENCEFRNIVFSLLSDQEVQDLCNNKREFPYRKGDIIHREGDPVVYFKYLKSGLVKMFRTTSLGEEQVITITKPFEFVSNINIFSEEKYTYSVAAVEDSVVCAVELDFIKKISIGNGTFAMGLLSKISKVNEKIITQTLDLRQRNLAGRVAYILLYFANEVYGTRVFDLPVSRQEIADFIGMSSANVIRTLSDFKKEGILKVNGKTIEITDIARLQMMSKTG